TTKLRTYENTSDFDLWRTRAVLAADDANKRDQPDPLGNDHVIQMERKDRLHIPYPVARAKVYLNDFAFADTTRQTKPAARDEFISQINQGAWFVDYIGHGSEDLLADEQLFRQVDVSRLTNVSRPAIFGYFSCTVGRFDEPSGEGLGELLLSLPNGGAVASIAASDETFGTQSTPFNDSFFDEMFPSKARVDTLRTAGLACSRAKNDNASATNMSVRKYSFLGDPALMPPLPRGRGAWEKGPLDSLLRGDPVMIQGHALMPDSTADTLSTGTVQILVQGPPFLRTQVAPLTSARLTYRIPGPTLYRGDVPLTAGRFQATFVVPIDGRLTGPGAKLTALLSAAGGRGVGLAVDSIRIAQGASTRTDGTAPTIRLFYPSGSDSTVRPGEALTFEIEDSSGVDLTRLDNAHTIFVIVDDRGTPYELTPQFHYDAGSYTRGRVDFAVPSLGDGAHVLEVHASDTFRNIAVRTFVIDMVTTSGSTTALTLDQVFNYPNPFAQQTYLHARLNQPARLSIKILTVAGRRIRDIPWDGKAGENYIPWDGTDSVGEKVAIGVYLFQVAAETPSGAKASAIGRALRTK
ncbi:MAG: C25 family cysteine peptidase, partial [Candidatus Eiseniibacteriota bacterium]